MRIETIKKLCCPFDHADLKFTAIVTDIDDRVLEGFLTCGSCNRLYPIVRGIPIMSPDEYREAKLEQPLLERWEDQLKGKSIGNFRVIAE